MKQKTIPILLCILTFMSCIKNKETISNEDLNLLLASKIAKYHETNEKKHLVFAYEKLNKNTEFIKEGLVGKNSFPIISLFMNLKKYDELEKLLIDNTTINEYNRINTLNTVRFLKLKDKNKIKADSYIKESLKMIKETIDKKPNDSLKYADYFSMRMFLVGKKETLKEVDSMKAVNKRYSDIFYDAILKDALESYPDEYLPK